MAVLLYLDAGVEQKVTSVYADTIVCVVCPLSVVTESSGDSAGALRVRRYCCVGKVFPAQRITRAGVEPAFHLVTGEKKGFTTYNASTSCKTLLIS